MRQIYFQKIQEDKKLWGSSGLLWIRCLFVFLFFCSLLTTKKLYAQTNGLYDCTPNLSCGGTQDYSNYGFNSNENPATLEYDNFVSAFHSTVARTAEGIYAWGEMMSNTGGNLLSPTLINTTNYPGLTGTILKHGVGGRSNVNRGQGVLLTTTGLFAWGKEAQVIRSTIKPGNGFAKINGSLISNADVNTALPSGVLPEEVRMMFVSNGLIVLTSCDGRVFVLSNGGPYLDGASTAGNGVNTAGAAAVVGNGLSVFTTASPRERWYQVMKTDGLPLTGIVAARGNGGGTMMALDSNGKLWTWGFRAFLGNGTSLVSDLRYATEMTLPAYSGSGHIKMIGMGSQAIATGESAATAVMSSSYYVLYSDGTLFAMGDNRKRQLGDFTTTTRTSWIQPRLYENGTPILNVKWISTNEHSGSGAAVADNVVGNYYESHPSVNIILNNGSLMNWGSSGGHMLGRGNELNGVNPGTPASMVGDKFLAVETGGHTTMGIRQCNTNFGYVGHRVSGSMGNGSDVNAFEENFSFATAPLRLCGASSDIELSASDVCSGNTFTVTASPEGGTFEVLSGNATYNASTQNFTKTGTGEIRIKYNAPLSCDILSDTLVIPACSDPKISLIKTGVLSTDGNTVTYSFLVKNTGNVTLNPVTVTDAKLTPTSVTLQSTSLAPGAETTGTATYTVTAAEKAAGQVQNTATATGTPPSGSPVTDISGTTFDNDTPTVVVVPNADLSVTKVVNNATPMVGQNVTFTITATNNGPSAATGVRVADNIPSGYTFVSATPSVGTWTAPNWTIGNLANGATATLTVVATVNATGSYTNTATVTGDQPDPTPGNNTDTETPTPVALAPKISLIKTGVLSTDGNTITYSFLVKNTGNVTLNPVTVTDTKLTPTSVTLQSTSLAPGAETTGTATYTVTAAEKASGQVENTATATGTPPSGSPVTDISGTTFDNDTPTVVVVPNADLSVTKVVNNATPMVGQNVTFTITATNNGPSAATGVRVSDNIPSGYTFVSATPSVGTWTAPNWTIGNLANGATATLTVVATVNATGSYTNTATVTGDQPDPTPGNNIDTETPTPVALAPKISLIKTGVLSTDGNTVTYSFLVKNTGNVTLNPVTVTDAKLTPTSVTLQSTSLAPGAETTGTATYTVTAAEKAAGQVENTATATGTPPSGSPVTDISGTTFDNDTPTVVVIPSADLQVIKVVSEEYPSVGDQVTFTITAKNNGPTNATGVVVTDALPSGYVFLNATPSTGVWSAPNWIIGNLANGASASMTIVAVVSATGNHANVVTVRGNQPDPTPGNNEDTAITYPGAGSDLEVTKTPNNFTPNVGEQITFTITAKNNGPRTATGVNVTDVLQSGYTFVSATPSQGVWSSPVWSLGTLANGASATMTVVATVNPTGNYRNTAIIDGVEPDPNPNNDTTTVVPNPGSMTDLEVTKVVNNQTPNIGEQVSFTITAKNNGPRNATGVTVSDQLPNGYTYVSHTVSNGTWNSPTWTVGNLASGASATLTIVATVNGTGSYANTATIKGEQPDDKPENNTDTEVTSPGQGTDLEVIKTVDITNPNVGDQVTFTLTAKNNGPRNATGVVVTDQVPSGFVVLNATPSIGTWSAPNWNVGNLSNGASATLTIVATVASSGNYTNKATIDGNESDPNPDNNEDEVTTPAPENQADLQVTKVADNMSPVIGSQVTFTITAKNNGPRNATGVVVSDQIPSGYVVLSVTPDRGVWSAPNWSIGNLANGASTSMTVVAVVAQTGSYANTATISGNQVDPDPGNNTSTVTPIPPVSAGSIALVKTGILSTDGNTITYSFTVTNTGNTTLTNVQVNDPKLSPQTVTLGSTTLAAGTSTTGTATYTVTQAEKESGKVINTATATGTPPTGGPVSDISGTEQNNNTPTEVVVPQPSSIALVKTGVLSTDGNTITYSFTVTNTGATTLTNVQVNDPKLSPQTVTLGSTTLAAGASTTGTATYTVTAAEKEAGKVINTATATGTPPTGGPVTDISGTTQNNDTPTEVPLDSDSSIALVKTGVLSSDGNTITYTFTVTNTGDVTLTNVKVVDPKLTPSNVPLVKSTLVPGESTTGTATYTLTEADKLGGKVTNTAITTGTTPSGCEVVDISGTEQDNDTPTEVELPCKPDLNPAITVLPNNGISGERNMVVLVDVKEILGCATKAGEEIRVSVSKVSDFSFNWSTYATATGIPAAGVTGLENARWTFTETSTAWVWVYNAGTLSANEISNIGLMGVWNAGASSGKLDFTVTIRNGSGGEVNTLNNVDYETVTYDVAP